MANTVKISITVDPFAPITAEIPVIISDGWNGRPEYRLSADSVTAAFPDMHPEDRAHLIEVIEFGFSDGPNVDEHFPDWELSPDGYQGASYYGEMRFCASPELTAAIIADFS